MTFRIRLFCVPAVLTLLMTAFPTQAAERLNVLFITLDDLNRDSVGVYGSQVPDTTPHIDQLAAEGLRFEHGHVTIAICQPTRAVWMTGRYPHNSGALGFTRINPGVPTLPETLREAGWFTGILGKTEHVVPSRPDAFEYRRNRLELFNGRSPDRYAEFTAEFFGQARSLDRPFFLMVNTHDPHRPFDNRKPAEDRDLSWFPDPHEQPQGRRRAQRVTGDFPAPSRIFDPEDIVVPGFLPDLPPIREEIAQYFSSVRRADDVVGRVLQELDRSGYRENTLVMLKSDHGIAVPFAKTNVWRHSTRVPWIVRWPGVIEPGRYDAEHVVAGVDFAPTILDAVGMKPLDGTDGRSFLTVLQGGPQAGREVVFTHINTIASGRSYTMRSVQGRRYGLIWNAWSDGETEFRNESMGGLTWKAMLQAARTDPAVADRVRHFRFRAPFEFYDYEQDPDARNNRINDATLADTIQSHRDQLIRLMASTNDPALAEFPRE